MLIYIEFFFQFFYVSLPLYISCVPQFGICIFLKMYCDELSFQRVLLKCVFRVATLHSNVNNVHN